MHVSTSQHLLHEQNCARLKQTQSIAQRVSADHKQKCMFNIRYLRILSAFLFVVGLKRAGLTCAASQTREPFQRELLIWGCKCRECASLLCACHHGAQIFIFIFILLFIHLFIIFFSNLPVIEKWVRWHEAVQVSYTENMRARLRDSFSCHCLCKA